MEQVILAEQGVERSIGLAWLALQAHDSKGLKAASEDWLFYKLQALKARRKVAGGRK